MSHHPQTSRVSYEYLGAILFCAFWLSSSTVAFASGSEGDSIRNHGLGPNKEILPLTLVWYDHYELLPFTFERMADETRRIFAELGVEIRWEKGQVGDAGRNLARDPLRFNVVLHPTEATAWGFKEGVMGLATYREGMKGSAYIFFPQIAKSLGLDLNFDSAETPRVLHMLSTAIGRVVAHELVHILAPYYPHTAKGLMREKVTRSVLRKRRVSFDPDSSQVILEELRRRQGHILVAWLGHGAFPQALPPRY